MTSLTLPSGAASFGSLGGAVTDNAALVAALALKLDKAGGTMTGALINSTNGAASTPAVRVTGTPFTGGSATTTKPLALIETAGATSTGWSTSGTMLGVNAPSGFTGHVLDATVNGSTSRLILNHQNHLLLAGSGGFRCTDPGLSTHYATFDGSNGVLLSFNHRIGWSATTAGAGDDAAIYRRAANHLALGFASATPTAQTWGGQQGSGTNITGGALNIGTRGTGTGVGGVINLQTHAAGSSGAALGTLVNVLSIISPGVVRITNIPTSSAGLSTGDIWSNLGILTIV